MTRRRSVGLPGLILCAGAMLAAGCHQAPAPFPPFAVSNNQQFLAGRAGPGLVADAESPIPDVPRPIGFKANIGASSSSFNGSARTVHHVYQGVGKASDAVTFYRQQLRTRGWQPTAVYGENPEGGGATATLLYTKGAEDLAVRINENGRITALIIDIAPRGMLGQ